MKESLTKVKAQSVVERREVSDYRVGVNRLLSLTSSALDLLLLLAFRLGIEGCQGLERERERERKRERERERERETDSGYALSESQRFMTDNCCVPLRLS